MSCIWLAEILENTKDTQSKGEITQPHETTDSVQRVVIADSGVENLYQTADFCDQDKGEIFSFGPPRNPVFTSDAQSQVDLGQFLSRPTLIKTMVWTESAFADTSFDPWTLYFSTSQIANKINNFAFFNGNLKIKVVLNAAPFYYGALLMAYTPLPAFANNIGVSQAQKIAWSQRPHIWLYPQTNTGGEMTLPFLYPKNYVDLTSATDVASLGSFQIMQYTVLQSANNATTNGVTIQVYAWVENPSLMGPTVKLSLQGGDEYGNGPLSAPATAVASFSDYLTNIPVIGRFAKATGIGARAVSHIAQLFGYTNVPVIGNVNPFKNLPFHDLASANISEPTGKFTLDPKGELSIDPGIIGLSNEDELTISGLVQRESYLTTTAWNTGDAAGSLLFSTVITPMMYDRGTATVAGTYFINMTPSAWVAQLFSHWRGDMIIRIKVIASKYHKGRLRVTWDPVGNLSASTDYSHVAFTKILDIGESDDFEVRIPYMQALPWLYTDTGVWTSNNFSTSSYISPSAKNNGSLTVRVLNNLSAPVDTAPAYLMVFVRGAENLEFANPRDVSNYTTFFQMQGGEENVLKSTPLQERYLVNFGEAVPSLRTLLRRSTLVDSVAVDLAGWTSSDIGGIYRIYQTRLPPSPGYDTNAYTGAKGVETPATTYKFSFANQTPLAWVSAAFVCLRGSVKWHYNVEDSGGSVTHSVSIYRTPTQTISANSNELESKYYTVNASTVTSQSIAKGNMWKLARGTGNGGVYLTNCLTQTGIGVELPMMNHYKFQYANPNYWLIGNSSDGSNTDTYQVDIMVHPTIASAMKFATLQRYVGIGTDFNLHFFLNAPVLYYNATMGNTPA